MSTTITPVGTTDTIFAFVQGWTENYATKNVLHAAMNSRGRTATVNGAGLRTGTLTLVVESEDEKTAAVAILNRPAVFQLSSSDLDSIDMTFVMSGGLSAQLDPQTLVVWTITFDIEEQA